MSIKAVHLELVSDLSSETFIGDLCRFISRRGRPENIYSDNATNFEGAIKKLKDLFDFIKHDKNFHLINQFCIDSSIKWHFNPPLAPNFGGLWESMIKSFEHHLYPVISNSLFTYEEFSTFVYEIEAILNSRPLCSLSSDPNDLQALTPGHFLIGNYLNGLPEQNLISTDKPQQLSGWQHITKVRQYFWSRWYKEYLNELNIRHKWSSTDQDLKIGTLVILKENHLPNMQWSLGRIVKVHLGDDNIVRVVSVKVLNNIYKRSVKNLAPLPVNVQIDN